MKNILFLQGVASPFFALLSDRLRERGQNVYRINFCAGDVAYWWPRPAVAFRGKVDQLRPFLNRYLGGHHITDIVLFGDRRPIHQVAIALAQERGIAVHVFEEGYLRPYWITMERGGVNKHSQLPKDPHWYRQVVAQASLDSEGMEFPGNFRLRAMRDVFYHAGDILNPIAFRGYRHHAPVHPIREYYWYIRRFPRIQKRLKTDLAATYDFVQQGKPYFLLPLQLYSDSQITCHSSFCDMYEFITTTLTSFALHGDRDLHLVVKNHPLDPGMQPYETFVADFAAKLGIAHRVHYYDYGDLLLLLEHSKGVVTINSTVGTWALNLGKPVLALADPIYHLPGLTSEMSLDLFWNAPDAPDPELWSAFKRVLIHTTQINGGFYCRAGMDLALDTAVDRIELVQSPLEELLCRIDIPKASLSPAQPAPSAPPSPWPTPRPV